MWKSKGLGCLDHKQMDALEVQQLSIDKSNPLTQRSNKKASRLKHMKLNTAEQTTGGAANQCGTLYAYLHAYNYVYFLYIPDSPKF